MPVVIFALMDAEYLRVERQFRKTYDRVRRENWDEPPNFDISPDPSADAGLIAVLCSWSIMTFYLPLAAAIVIVGLVVQAIGLQSGAK